MQQDKSLKGKHIVLGITGSIAAYKACTLIRLLIKAGAEVQVVITPAGKEFITPITLSALTSKPVISDFFAQRDGTWHSHVALGQWADAMIIAPATASTIGKMANGIADNMLITTYLSMKAPVFVAPAMDLDMFAHPTTTENLQNSNATGCRSSNLQRANWPAIWWARDAWRSLRRFSTICNVSSNGANAWRERESSSRQAPPTSALTR